MMPSNTLQDEASLIERARRDPSAFAALYHRYLTPLYRYLYRRLGNTHDAEDLTAQVFTEALEGLVAYRERGKFVAWLFTIARHRLTDFYRQRVPAALDDDLPSVEPDLLTAIETNDDHSHIASLLAQLDDEKQELLRLRFAAGLSFAEIAALEGRREAAVKMTIYRSLDWLRNHWEAENG